MLTIDIVSVVSSWWIGLGGLHFLILNSSENSQLIFSWAIVTTGKDPFQVQTLIRQMGCLLNSRYIFSKSAPAYLQISQILPHPFAAFGPGVVLSVRRSHQAWTSYDVHLSPGHSMGSQTWHLAILRNVGWDHASVCPSHWVRGGTQTPISLQTAPQKLQC